MRMYAGVGLCLFLVRGIAPGGEGSWARLILRNEQLCLQGKFAEAEAVLLDALEHAKKFAPTDIRLAETQHHLARVYRELGRLPKAEKWYQRSMSTWKERIRKGDHSMPKPLIEFVSLYLENGLHAKAERLLSPWLHNITIFGTSNPSAVRLLHNFAALQHTQRKHDGADNLYRHALQAAEAAFGPKSQEVALILNNLGLLLVDTGRHNEAGSHLERALAIWENVSGPNHPDVARALTNLAAFYSSTGKKADAEPLFRRALDIAERRLGPDNRLVGTILAEYAVVLRKTKRKDEAKLLERRAQAIRQSQSPDDLGRHTVDFRDLLIPRD